MIYECVAVISETFITDYDRNKDSERAVVYSPLRFTSYHFITHYWYKIVQDGPFLYVLYHKHVTCNFLDHEKLLNYYYFINQKKTHGYGICYFDL
jgi:hypothetical protein